MTANEIATLRFADLDQMSVNELKSVKIAAGHAYSVVGDHAKYNYVNPKTGQSQNLLQEIEFVANVLIKNKS